jgi:DNA polymerase-3 subunit gamma/tau
MISEKLTIKYRPSTFKDMVGQEYTIQMLSNGVESGKIGQVILMAGLKGSGKTTAARVVAKGINCIKGRTSSPCGVCQYCVDSLLIIEIDGAQNNGVNEARSIQESLRYMTHDNKTKVYIIDEVHMLTTEAFNALLKTLEEPPEHVMFILATTEPHKLPGTILSRVQQYNFIKIPIDKIVNRLKDILSLEGFSQYTEDSIMLIAEQADGSLRDALKILEQCLLLNEKLTSENVYHVIGTLDSSTYLLLLKTISNNDFPSALSLIDKISDSGIQPDSFYKNFLQVITNVLRKKFYLAKDKEILSQINLNLDDIRDIHDILQRDMKSFFIDFSIIKIFQLDKIKQCPKTESLNVTELITKNVIESINTLNDNNISNQIIKSEEEKSNNTIIHSYLAYHVFEKNN